MLFMQERKAYIISAVLFGICLWFFIAGFGNTEEQEPESIKLSYNETLTIQSHGFVELEIKVIARHSQDFTVQLVEDTDSVYPNQQQIQITYGSRETYVINIEPHDPFSEVNYFWINERDYIDVVTLDQIDIGNIILDGEGEYDITLEHIDGNMSSRSMVQFTDQTETGINLGRQDALMVTIGSFFLLLSVTFFVIVSTKRRNFNKLVRAKRYERLGVVPIKEQRRKERQIYREAKRKETNIDKVISLNIKKPHGRNYFIGFGLLLVSIGLIFATIIEKIFRLADSAWAFELPAFIPITALLFFLGSLYLLMNTLTGRKAYFRSQKEREALLEEERQKAMDEPTEFEDQIKTKEDSE